jgi:uncharacterized membrane protein YhiD involved in acid resistance
MTPTSILPRRSVLFLLGSIAALLSAVPQLIAQTAGDGDSFLSNIFGANAEPASVAENALQICGRLLLAVILSGTLALRPLGNVRLFRRNLHVAQTEILLSVVAAALMMVVGDNAARAFGIFAAVSIVRFRTNIRDPKEITVLLISLALGLAAGVGRWELGIALCLFSLVLLWSLEHNESGLVFRSMQLKVKARDMQAIQKLLTEIFARRNVGVEVKEFAPPHDKKAGTIVYTLSLPLNVSTDEINDEIISLSSERLEGIEWEQQKNHSDMYQ